MLSSIALITFVSFCGSNFFSLPPIPTPAIAGSRLLITALNDPPTVNAVIPKKMNRKMISNKNPRYPNVKYNYVGLIPMKSKEYETCFSLSYPNASMNSSSLRFGLSKFGPFVMANISQILWFEIGIPSLLASVWNSIYPISPLPSPSASRMANRSFGEVELSFSFLNTLSIYISNLLLSFLTGIVIESMKWVKSNSFIIFFTITITPLALS